MVFGATGFVGRLIAAYLDEHAPAGLRLAIAGRDAERLAAVARGLRRPVGTLVAAVDDPAALRAMVAATRVLLTTVGPYARLGEPVAAACAELGTDYLDLTGEPAFVARLIDRHDAAARASGALLVPCCGFDSVPADLGALYTALQLPRDGAVAVDAYFTARGGFSGGTLASALEALAGPQGRPRGPRGGSSARSARRGLHRVPGASGWAVPLPTIDPKVVLRSARIRGDYGRSFTYGHYLRLSSLPAVGVAALGVGALVLAARVGPLRRYVQRRRPPGSGPDEATRRDSFFKFVFHGRAGAERVVTEFSGGDPGYDETARMCGEAALCLVGERDALPPGGVLTPASAFGERLIARLQAAGLTIRVLERGR